MKISPMVILKTAASSLIWGLGQLLNKQWIKALFFFGFFALFLTIEFSTSSYGQEISIYKLMAGQNITSETSKGIFNDYYYNLLDGRYEDTSLLEYVAEINNLTYDADTQLFLNASGIAVQPESNNIQFREEQLYDFLAEQMRKIDETRDLRTNGFELLLEYDVFKAFQDSIVGGLGGRDNYNTDAYNKMLVQLMFRFDETIYERYAEVFLNPFHENAGFFVKGLWGVITLGVTPSRTVTEHYELTFFIPDGFSRRGVELQGNFSQQLLLRGIISNLLLVYFIGIFIWNIRDAFKTAKIIEKTKKVPDQVQYFKDVYENAFEYIVLMPALFLVTFISVMPILFGMLVAFTNYDAQHIPPNNLFTWVGLENFRVIFTLNEQGGLPFGTQFFRVFSWTLIWAFASTFTVFFGGFIQAVILANNRVVFRKVWRSLLILPWAIPALISQMVFNVMFRDRGWVNQTLSNIGVYDWLIERGMLGRSFAEAGTGLDRLLYFGEENIQWISNEANPWFVRIFIIVLNIWLGFPFFMALMTGVMTSIDRSLYEAASIDGATGFQQFRFITMPLVLFATSPLLIMTFAGNFNNFGVIYFITQGGPGGDFTTAFAGQTDILISWIYKLTTDANVRWYSMASVFSLLIFLIIGTISAWNFTRTRAFKEEM
jgi:arabinogalactan oligomer / maltooligosaccharide transport system permease protein